MCCLSETQTLHPVQVFDKTMVVKQMHVLEPQDLLITRADKGTLGLDHTPIQAFLLFYARYGFLLRVV